MSSHLRYDQLLGHTVIIAPERAARPIELAEGETHPLRASCDFCEGHETATTGETFAFRNAGAAVDAPGWQLRVIPNKFPAVREVESVLPHLPHEPHVWPYTSTQGWGVHEVIIETPHHFTLMQQLKASAYEQILHAYAIRLAQLSQDPRLRHGLIFKNVGGLAGASMEHLHSQLVALPEIPRAVAAELAASERYFAAHQQCPFCAVVRQELVARERIVAETEHFVAFCPYAARTPYETWIVPRRHEAHFHSTPRENFGELGNVLRKVLIALEQVLQPPTYNYLIHQSPFDSCDAEHYHWHVEIIPRVTKLAGFELATGYYINPVPPEHAASVLRTVQEKSSV